MTQPSEQPDIVTEIVGVTVMERIHTLATDAVTWVDTHTAEILINSDSLEASASTNRATD